MAIIPCMMNFRFYPVDVQNCQFHLRSFSFPVDEMTLKWAEPPVLRKLHLPQHSSQLSSSNATYVNVLQAKQYSERNYLLDDIPAEMKFSLLTISIRLSRDISNKIAGVYIPTALIVTVCFSTFWFGSKSISDRVTVGVTALLAFITQFIETRKFIPPISYISWMDVWMLMCMVFVFIQLIEGTVVHYFYLRGKHLIRLRRKNLKRSLKVFQQETDQPQQTDNKFSTLFSSTDALRKTVGKWRKVRDPLIYEPPPAELLINRFKYANHVQRREKFAQRSTTQNHVQFDFNVTETQKQTNARDPVDKNRLRPISQLNSLNFDGINYPQSSPIRSANNTADKSAPFTISQSPKSSDHSSFYNNNWQAEIDYRSALSGSELLNLDLLQLLNDQNVRYWLTETIYPDHVNFGLMSLIKHYWKILFLVDLPPTSAHYMPLKIDKFARVFVPLLYLFCLGVYVLVILACMEIDNTTTLDNIFAYKHESATKSV